MSENESRGPFGSEPQPRIADACPSCGSTSIFIGSGGWLTCAVLRCKQPGVGTEIDRLKERARALSFDRLRAVNVDRCVNGFGHTLESWSPAEWTNALAGEAGEAANVAKKMLRHRDKVAGNQGDDTDLALLREKLGRERADVVSYADLCAARQGLDLAQLVRDVFNRKSEQIGSPARL